MEAKNKAGWRPVGGLVMHGALKEIGLAHRYVYGRYDDPATIGRVAASEARSSGSSMETKMPEGVHERRDPPAMTANHLRTCTRKIIAQTPSRL